MGYRTVFCFDLMQTASLSVTGSEAEGFDNLAPFARNGKGRLTIRGASLAGAMFATAEKIYGNNNIPRHISFGFGRASDTDRLFPSSWRVWHTHPKGDVPTEIRQSVGIRLDTGARADGVLFDVEVTPKGTRWPVILEVITADETAPTNAGATATFPDQNIGDISETIAAQVLMEWARGRAWIGGNVARGLGWVEVHNLRALRLDHSDALAWPDNRKDPQIVIDGIAEDDAREGWIAQDQFEDTFGRAPDTSDWTYLSATCEIEVGHQNPAEDDYGLDVISVGGQTGGIGLAARSETALVPDGMITEKYFAENAFEEHIATTACGQNGIEPIIPGSGIRGPLRHSFARFLNHQEGTSWVRDPNVTRAAKPTEGDGPDIPAPDAAEVLFGSLERSANLLVSDASLLPESGFQSAILHHHAEDEFTASVYGDGKFTRSVLVSGTFRFTLVLELRGAPETKGDEGDAPAADQDKNNIRDEDWQTFTQLMTNLGASGHLPIGAAKWRGAGWPVWRFSDWKKGKAGQDPARIDDVEGQSQ